jgi:hypothetical protein
MTTLIVEDLQLKIPSWVRDLESFRRWAHAADFPEHGNIWWLRGGIWADMSMEQIFSHLAVKGEFTRVLGNLVVEIDSGTLLPDGLLLTNIDADLSGKPDLTYFSYEAQEERRIRLIEGSTHGYTEVIGSPDMVLEIVSDSSVEKDMAILPEDYFAAGIIEYWRVDARESPPTFEIFRRNLKAFVAVRKQGGWLKSTVFGKFFRLSQSTDRAGNPKYRLEMK